MSVPFLDLKTQFAAIKDEAMPEIEKVFESCAYIGGSYVKNFEGEVEKYLHVSHAIGCSSGTAALILALRACGVKPGDEVITTPFTFFATAESIASIGAIPVFVDVKAEDYTIDETLIEAAITEKTKAIMPVHIFGACCEMDTINAIAKKHHLRVIEDCAQAIGAEYKGKKAGTLGDVGCFSFYPTKNLGGCGDGGMVTTNDDDLAVILNSFREHGAGKNGAKALELLEGQKVEIQTKEQATELYDPYKYFNFLIGYNSRLDAVQAAVLSIKLRHLDDYNKARAHVAERYFAGLDQRLIRPVYNADQKCCWHQFVVRSQYKEELCAFLSENGVGSGSFYPVPLHQQKAFTEKNCKNPSASLPVAEQISAESVCLPIFPEMTEAQIDEVIAVVNRFYEEKV